MEHYWELTDDRTRKGNWLRSLLALGMKPTQEILFEVPMWQWQVWEMTIIQWYRALGWIVVNTAEGGDGVTVFTDEMRAKCGLGFKGRHHTPEARAKIAAGARGRKQSAEQRAKISAAHKGKPHPPHTAEHRAKIGEALRGIKLSPERVQKLRDRPKVFGSHHTPESRAAISAARKGKKHSDESRAKITASRLGKKNPMFGRHLSDEHKAKLRAANKGRKMSPEFCEQRRLAALGKKASPEARARMSAAHMGMRNKLRSSKDSAFVTSLPSQASNPA